MCRHGRSNVHTEHGSGEKTSLHTFRTVTPEIGDPLLIPLYGVGATGTLFGEASELQCNSHTRQRSQNETRIRSCNQTHTHQEHKKHQETTRQEQTKRSIPAAGSCESLPKTMRNIHNQMKTEEVDQTRDGA